MGDRGEAHSLRVLSPDEKVNMSLDEIIKIEHIRPAISHNMYRRKRFFPSKRPIYHRKRISQQWRLGRNGPNTSRWHKYRTHGLGQFLAHKRATAGPRSVFHRLGWDAGRYRAQRIFHRAKFQEKPFFMPFRYQPAYDPQRFQKIVASRRRYQQRFSGLPEILPKGERVERLSEVLGGTITAVNEETLEDGSLITTIVRKCPSSNYTAVEFLDPVIQRSIAHIQNKDLQGISSPHFDARKFTVSHDGLDTKYTDSINLTNMSTSDRFKLIQGDYKMDIDVD